MRLYSTLIFLLVIVSPLNDPGQLTNAQTNLAEARKVDEFGDAQYSDIAARLDSFAQELQRTPEAHAFLIAYRSRRDLPGLSSRLVNWLKDYLVNTRGFAADRIVAIDGGVAGWCRRAPHRSRELTPMPRNSTILNRRESLTKDLFMSAAIIRSRMQDISRIHWKDFPKPCENNRKRSHTLLVMQDIEPNSGKSRTPAER
jgi:hypothetical protein